MLQSAASGAAPGSQEQLDAQKAVAEKTKEIYARTMRLSSGGEFEGHCGGKNTRPSSRSERRSRQGAPVVRRRIERRTFGDRDRGARETSGGDRVPRGDGRELKKQISDSRRYRAHVDRYNIQVKTKQMTKPQRRPWSFRPTERAVRAAAFYAQEIALAASA